MVGFTIGGEDNWTSNDVPAVTEPVLTQPGLGVTTTTVTTIMQTGGDWSTGLFDVCGDKTTCNTNPQLYFHKHRVHIHLSQLYRSPTVCTMFFNLIFTHKHLLTCVCTCRYSRGSGAVLFRPEFSSPVWWVSVHASPTRIHFCHTSWDQRAVQDTGEWVYSCAEKCVLLVRVYPETQTGRLYNMAPAPISIIV